MRSYLKRTYALAIVVSMIVSMFSMPAGVMAKEKTEKKLAAEQNEKALKQKIKDSADSSEYPNGLIAFGESQMSGTEGSDSEMLIVRAGGTKGKAKVTVKAIGVSAKYGEDYLLSVQEGKKKTVLDGGDDTSTLMEKYGENLSIEDTDSKESDNTEQAGRAAGAKFMANASETGTAKMDELSGLQKATAMQNGSVGQQKSWREVNDKESSGYKEAEEMMTQGKKNLLDAVKDMNGAEYTFTFEEGEYKKAIDISVIDDSLSEGDEQIMFIISDVSGAASSDNYTAYFNIKDDEEAEENVYEMNTKKVSVRRGTDAVELTVNKTSGTEKMSVLTVGTSAVTAKEGVDYETVKTSLVFAPGMKSKTVTVPLIKESETTGEVSFYVGLESKDGVVNNDKNATLVMIRDKVESGAVEYEAHNTVSAKSAQRTSKDKDSISTKAEESRTVYSGDYKIDSWNGSWTDRTVISGLDLRTATKVRVTFYSTEGSTTVTEGSGCKKHDVTKKDREVWFDLGSNDTKFYDYVADSFSCNEASVTLSSNQKKKDMKLRASVRGVNGNKNATLHVKEVVVTYPAYTVTIKNDWISNANGKIVDSCNAYQEILYTAAKTKKNQGQPFYIGEGKTNRELSKAYYFMDDALGLSYEYNGTSKTSGGVSPNRSNAPFDCFQIYNVKSGKWQDIKETKDGKSITLGTLLNNYKECLDKERFSLRPKFSISKTMVKFLNNSYTTVGEKKIKQSDAGEFAGFNNNSTLTLNLLDTVQITGTPKAGYSVSGFSVYDSSNKNPLSYKKTGSANVIKLSPPTTHQINVDLLYEKSKIEVLADPSGQNTGKGSVLYTHPKDSSKMVSGDAKHKMTIDDAMIGTNYKIIGLANSGTSFKTPDGKNVQYRAVWRDGTIDVDSDGVLSDKEKKDANGYKEFSPVSGNVLSFSPSRAYTKVYYDFAIREEVTKKANRAYLMGTVSLADKVLFTGKTSVTPLNGVQVVADGDTAMTQHTDGDKYTDECDGYYIMDGDGTYYAYDYMLMTYTYNAPNGAVLVANEVANPNSHKDVIFHTDSVMDVDSALAFYVKEDKDKKTTEEKSINYMQIDNGNYKYRLKFHVSSKNPDLQPRKGILCFYSPEGTEVKRLEQEIKPGDSGQFSFEFNPGEEKFVAGTRITFQVEDQNGTRYYERETGIKLTENSFHFGGASTVVDLMGKVDSAFDLGWSGNFDSKSNDSIVEEEVKDEEGKVIGTAKTMTVGFSTGGSKQKFDIDSLRTRADKKAKTQEKYLNETLKVGKKNADKVTGKDKEKLDKLKKEMDDAAKEFDDAFDDKSNPKKTSAKVVGNVTADVSVSLALRFLLDEERAEYYFDSMILNATVSAGFGADLSFATPIGITISIGFKIGVDNSGATFVIAQREDLANPTRYYLTKKNDKTEDGLIEEDGKINLFDFSKSLDNPYSHTGTFDVNPYITLTAGVGVLGDMIKVSVSGKAQFYMTFFTDDRENSGSLTLTASIGVKVLFISHEWPFATMDAPMFGNASKSSTGMEELNYLHDSSRVLRADDKDYLKNRSKWNTADVSAKSLDENENGVAQATILEGLYNGTDIKVQAINEDGDYLGIFLDDELDENGKPVRAEEDSAAAYYSIYDHTTGQWAKPVLLEDDGFVDQDLNIFDLGDRGMLVTWSSANKKLGDGAVTSRTEMMNAMDIHGCFFDKTTKKFGGIDIITKETPKDEDGNSDFAGDISPSVVYNDKSLLIYYTKNEYAVSDSKEGEVVGDVVYPEYSLQTYRQYTFAGNAGTEGKWITDYAQLNDNGKTKEGIMAQCGNDEAKYNRYVEAFYGQVFFDPTPSCYVDEKLDDEGYWTEEPMIYNRASWSGGSYEEEDGKVKEPAAGIVDEKVEISGSDAETYQSVKILDTDSISYNNLGLLAYTVDYDQSMSTTTDRDVVLQIYDFETGEMTHRVMVTCDQAADSGVKFVRAEDSDQQIADTYLTWISDGNIVATDISNIIRSEKGLLQDEKSGVYYINKSRDSGYIPASVMVQADVNEETGELENAVTSFDVHSTDGYVYVSWTQSASTLKKGVEENSEEALKTENQLIENQIYMARYDMAEGMMTGKVQVTSEEGANYNDLSFVVNSDATLTALATKMKSKVVDADEFNKMVDEYNETAFKDQKMDQVAEDDYVEYAAPDGSKSLVSLQIRPVSVMKVSDLNMDKIKEGEQNQVGFTLLNDGIDTLKNAKLTVTDGNGSSILLEGKQSAEKDAEAEKTFSTTEYEKVDSITIDKLMGGDTYQGVVGIDLDEHETSATVKIRLVDADGRTLIDETYNKEIEENYLITDLAVTETEERDVYHVSFDVENGEYRYVSAKKATVGIRTKDGDVALAEIDVPELEKNKTGSYETTVRVDSSKQFVESDGENGFLLETGTFFVRMKDEIQTQDVVRKASGAQMEAINGIKEGMIGDGKGISLGEGDMVSLTANIKSSLANEELGTTGTEGLQVVWEVEDDSIVSVDADDRLTGLKKGTTGLKAYVMPKNSESIVAVDESQKAGDYNFGDEVSNYSGLPNAAIKVYSAKVTVSEHTAKTPSSTVTPTPGVTPAPKPPAVNRKKTATQKGIRYTVSGKNAVVSKMTKKTASVSIPARVKIGGKYYPVTQISANAFKNNKKLKKVTIGKNVKTIKKNAFYGCRSLKRVVFKGKKVTAVGKNAFKRIAKKAVIRVPKKVLKKYKKLLNKKVGVTKKMKIKS